MAPFKVVIVGGSVSGLALANMLEQCDIDYVLLEKYEAIAPDLGACLGLQPNGLRIMDQLGCYQELLKISWPTNYYDVYDGTSQDLNRFINWPLGSWQTPLLGYKLQIQDRKQVISVLHDNLRDKSKVHTSQGVVKIHPLEDGVKVETIDGSMFEGDIVVGADGIHSHVLDEMQRLAEIDMPGSKLFTRDEFECTYRCIFSIGYTPESLRDDQAIKVSYKGRSYLCLSGQDRKFYFCLFEQIEKTRGSSMPRRYTKEETDALAAKYSDDILVPGVTFGDMYSKKSSAVMLPVQEGLLSKCFYERIVLVGDSFHKSTPLLGQGGNNCLVSAVVLANKLHSITRGDSKPDMTRLRQVFHEYQESRKPENSMIISLGREAQQMDAQESQILKFIYTKIVPRLPLVNLLDSIVQPHTAISLLDYLPPPPSSGDIILSHREVQIKPGIRSSTSNAVWAVLLLLPMLIYNGSIWYGNGQILPTSGNTLPFQLSSETAEQLYFHIAVTGILSIMMVESYRGTYTLKLLSSATIFTLASFQFGWLIGATLYFLSFLLETGRRTFYYPSVRLIDPRVLILLGPVYVMTYTPALYCTLTSASFPSKMWDLSHIAFPIVIYMLRLLTGESIAAKPTVEMVAKNSHIKYLSLASYLLLIPQLFSVRLMNGFSQRLISFFEFNQATSVSTISMKSTCLEVIILVFLVFALLDLHRVHASSRPILVDILLGIPLILFAGPVAALVLFWGIREVEWNKACQKKSVGTS
ncbi:Monooxygenase FAD-binding [Penicillium herquei]|nr:Monooxygenase FAD-binding [Penicillium herquei]